MSRKTLQEFVETFERITADKPVSRELAWFLNQTNAYLNGEYDTLEEALGLVDKPRRRK